MTTTSKSAPVIPYPCTSMDFGSSTAVHPPPQTQAQASSFKESFKAYQEERKDTFQHMPNKQHQTGYSPAQSSFVSGSFDVKAGSPESQDANIFKKLKETFATGTPLLPLPTTAGQGVGAGTKGSSKWSLWDTGSQQQSWFEDFGLSFRQRLAFAVIFAIIGCMLLTLSMMRVFGTLFSPASFAFPYCLSTLFFITSVGFVRGMKTHFGSFFKRDKIMFSGVYLCSTLFTLFLAWRRTSYPIMLVFVIAQFFTLAWFLISFIPGGTTGVSTASKVAFSSFLSRF